MNSETSYYKLLEIPETSDVDIIKKAYRRLSMIYHPDKNGNSQESTEKFQKISEAYEVLGDPEKKREYDMMQNNPFFKMMNPGSMNHGSMNHGSMNPVDEILSNIFGLPFMGMNMGQGPDIQFSPNIRVFQNGRPMTHNINNPFTNPNPFTFAQKPPPIIINIIVSIDKILTGTTIPVEIERWLIENGIKMVEHETLYIDVPKGVDEGEIIIIKDKGNSAGENNKGDIKIFVKIENTTEFKRNGLDLILEKTITLKEALCGFSFELKYISGKVYTITNNSGNIISHGYRKIIPNMGLTRDEHIGNLVIYFNVKFPENLTEEVLSVLQKHL